MHFNVLENLNFSAQRWIIIEKIVCVENFEIFKISKIFSFFLCCTNNEIIVSASYLSLWIKLDDFCHNMSTLLQQNLQHLRKYAACWKKKCIKMIWYYRVTGKAIGKSENLWRIGEAFCQMIEGLLTIVIDNGFRKRDKSRAVIVYLPERWVRKVNCWVVSRATTTSVQKSIPTETCSEIAICISHLIFFIRFSCAASYTSRRISNISIKYQLCKIYIIYIKFRIYIYLFAIINLLIQYATWFNMYLSLSKIVKFVREILSRQNIFRYQGNLYNCQ